MKRRWKSVNRYLASRHEFLLCLDAGVRQSLWKMMLRPGSNAVKKGWQSRINHDLHGDVM
jgi:hypothetical protein